MLRALLPGAGSRLAVYGTLAPGEANHHLLAACRGVFASGFVRGTRAVREFPVFTPDPNAPLVAVRWLASVDLWTLWPALDAFEGEDYRRVLVPVLGPGSELVTVANLYAAVVPVRG
ncbi:MAG: gamma-glutamylcyclotransferase [Planctomycetes bacterium]|nr:gamma-glutamylcyclotransferase [Planctomycetota bacterium]